MYVENAVSAANDGSNDQRHRLHVFEVMVAVVVLAVVEVAAGAFLHSNQGAGGARGGVDSGRPLISSVGNLFDSLGSTTGCLD